MRILHVTQRYLPAIGGAELYLAGISQRLAGEGHSVTVVTTDALDFELFWNPQARRISQPESVIDGVRVLRFSVRHLPAPQLAYPAIRRILWLLSRSRVTPVNWIHRLARFTPWTPDLYRWLAQTTETFDLVAGMTVVFEPLIESGRGFARKHGLPFVIYPLTHLGADAAPGSDDVSRFYTMRHQVELVTNSSFLIAINEDEAAFYQARGLPGERSAVAGPGIAIDELQGGNGERLRAQHGLQGPVIGMLSSLAYDKGAVHLVEAVRGLWQQGRIVHLVLAGAVLSQFKSYLDRLPETDRKRIVVLGAVDHQTKLDLLDALDVLALPSRTDSFGIVYLEAWVYKKPVIGARSWGVRTVIDEGQDGLLVPFGDVPALAQAIEALLDNPAQRQQMGERGHAKVLNRHTWGRKYPLVRDVYTRLARGEMPFGRGSGDKAHMEHRIEQHIEQKGR